MSQSTFTRCPECGTVFRVTEQHLKIAHGKVRCGACLNVFVATQYLVKPKQTSSSTASPEHPSDNDSPNKDFSEAGHDRITSSTEASASNTNLTNAATDDLSLQADEQPLNNLNDANLDETSLDTSNESDHVAYSGEDRSEDFGFDSDETSDIDEGSDSNEILDTGEASNKGEAWESDASETELSHDTQIEEQPDEQGASDNATQSNPSDSSGSPFAHESPFDAPDPGDWLTDDTAEDSSDDATNLDDFDAGQDTTADSDSLLVDDHSFDNSSLGNSSLDNQPLDNSSDNSVDEKLIQDSGTDNSQDSFENLLSESDDHRTEDEDQPEVDFEENPFDDAFSDDISFDDDGSFDDDSDFRESSNLEQPRDFKQDDRSNDEQEAELAPADPVKTKVTASPTPSASEFSRGPRDDDTALSDDSALDDDFSIDRLNQSLTGDTLEPDPLDEFDDIVDRKSHKWKWLSGIGVGVLALVWGITILWTERQTLAWSDTWGGLVHTMCIITPCELKERRNLDAIELLQRDIRPADDNPDITEFNLYIRNNADFEQPYPTVEIAFTDTRGEIVSREIHTPEEYLSVDTRNTKMPTGQKTLILIRAKQAYANAFGFEFDFK